MGIEPVAGDAMAGRETHLALIDSLHFLDDDALHAVEFLGDDIKVEFVMHLENHFGLDTLVLETPVDAHHGELDDIGRRALDGSVDGVALAETPHHGIARVDVGQHAPPSIKGGDIAFLARLGDAAVDVLAHLREGGVVAIDEHLGFIARDVQPLGEPKGADAIQDAKIGRFGLAAFIAGDQFERLVVNASGRDGMDVVIVGKGLEHGLVMAQVSNQAQLNL